MTQSKEKIRRMAMNAKKASFQMALLSTSVKDEALRLMAKVLESQASYLIRENHKDLQAAEKAGYANSLIDRLTLNEKRIEAMAQSLLATVAIKDPVGEVIKRTKRPNGLIIEKVRTPIGVICIIYESRPNVTSDTIGLCLKSGNAVILKGGKEAYYSNKAIFTVMRNALKGTKIPLGAIGQVDSTDRKAMQYLLTLDEFIDLIVPRGGEGLIHYVAEHSRIPVIKHYKGVCHTYVSRYADLDMARNVCFNAKVQRPGVCNAMETLLVDQGVAWKFLPVMIPELQHAGVEIRADALTRQIIKDGIKTATVEDWRAEYLDLILAVRVVDGVNQAVDHINTSGSHHSEAIITENKIEAKEFLKAVDSAALYVNASTRFTDGYEFGFGAEVGISTDKLHARGPMALEELTTYKYLIYGQGHIRQ